jgi:hypothetical protein
MKLRPEHIHVGDFYVNEEKGQVQEIVQEAADGSVSWQAYSLSDGRPTGDSFLCSRQYMARWATCEAIAVEMARLQRHVPSPFELEDKEAILGIAEAGLKLVSDAALLVTDFFASRVNSLSLWARARSSLAPYCPDVNHSVNCDCPSANPDFCRPRQIPRQSTGPYRINKSARCTG